jgi:hypothetical protein
VARPALWRRMLLPGLHLDCGADATLGIGANAAIFTLLDKVLIRRCRSNTRSSWSFVETAAGARNFRIRRMRNCVTVMMS